MARPLRIEYEGAVYHIVSRGNERQRIFRDSRDYKKFFHYLKTVHERYNIILYSYCLMGNHYHLLIETPKPYLSYAMRDLNGHYTVYFNIRHKRTGHLFQGRYKAILIDKQHYLAKLSRYIHLNPVKAKIVQRPEEYAYSSMKGYLGKDTNCTWINHDYILEQLEQFGKDRFRQRRNYLQYIQAGIETKETELGKIFAQAILGTESFIKNIQENFLKNKNISKEVPMAKKLQYDITLEKTAHITIHHYKIDKQVLLRRKTRSNLAKKAFVYLARRFTDSTLREISDYLNNSVGEVGISQIFNRFQGEIDNSKIIKKDIDTLTKQLFN